MTACHQWYRTNVIPFPPPPASPVAISSYYYRDQFNRTAALHGSTPDIGTNWADVTGEYSTNGSIVQRVPLTIFTNMAGGGIFTAPDNVVIAQMKLSGWGWQQRAAHITLWGRDPTISFYNKLLLELTVANTDDALQLIDVTGYAEDNYIAAYNVDRSVVPDPTNITFSVKFNKTTGVRGLYMNDTLLNTLTSPPSAGDYAAAWIDGVMPPGLSLDLNGDNMDGHGDVGLPVTEIACGKGA